ncbi:hypothetical protein GOBAR_AA06697 [Gossypium barbadense]|uniref:Mannosyltransferase n=1 Tax=Gossypium barbadense TaxID=3634 RepID=A0A2P5YE84_GOSBA|nr:hypothetical protein GOBAR_AA06697 [Gossypium barbadense]
MVLASTSFLPSSFSMYAMSLSFGLFLLEKPAWAVAVAAVGVILGGGESHLYGIEGPLFYIRNGFNNFNFCFILALLFLGILPNCKKKPHKEERFLYPIYPLVCVAASAVIESFTDLFRDKYNPYDNSIIVMMAKFLRPVALSLILCASHSRTFSLINGYAAPMEVYKILEHHDDAGTGNG